MDISKIDRFIALQERVNRQIDTYGEAEPHVVDEMMELIDTLTPEEMDEVTRRYWLEER